MSAIGIGFIPLPASTAEPIRESARLVLGQFAEKEHVALRHVYEPPGTDPDQVRASMTTLEDVAAMYGARTLLVFGGVTADLVDLTRRAELRLLSVPDPTRRRSAGHQPDPSAETPWLGRLEVDLENGRRWRVATIELDVRSTVVAITLGARPIGHLDRRELHAWLHDPTEPIAVPGIIWFAQDGMICIGLEGSASYLVPAETADHLKQVI